MKSQSDIASFTILYIAFTEGKKTGATWFIQGSGLSKYYSYGI